MSIFKTNDGEYLLRTTCITMVDPNDIDENATYVTNKDGSPNYRFILQDLFLRREDIVCMISPYNAILNFLIKAGIKDFDEAELSKRCIIRTEYAAGEYLINDTEKNIGQDLKLIHDYTMRRMSK